jgi:DnaK suppressor protein
LWEKAAMTEQELLEAATWPEQVSNEGHVYAAFDQDRASLAVEEPRCPLDGDYEDRFAFRAAHRNMEANQVTNTDLTPYRARLFALRARLLGDMTQMKDDSLNDHCKTTSIPTDREELGSDDADQELTVDLLESDEDILDQIEAAIQRIDDGSYGQCEECGEQIPKTRLDAIPYAAECERCASQEE